MIDVSLVNAELNPVLEIGVKEIKRIDEDNWSNYQFTALLAGIAVYIFYFLVKSKWLLPSKDQEPKGTPKDKIDEEFAKVSEANYRPVEDDETEKLLKIVFKGAKWGFVAGFVVAMVYIRMHTPPSLGFYVGDVGLVFLICLGPGAAIGALFAWLSTLIFG